MCSCNINIKLIQVNIVLYANTDQSVPWILLIFDTDLQSVLAAKQQNYHMYKTNLMKNLTWILVIFNIDV